MKKIILENIEKDNYSSFIFEHQESNPVKHLKSVSENKKILVNFLNGSRYGHTSLQMNKAELISTLSRKKGKPQIEANAFLKAFTSTVTDSL